MNWIYFIIGLGVIFYLKRIFDRKIDEDERKALSTPGRANFLRDNYQDVITFLENKPGYKILFERVDMVKIGMPDGNEYYAVSNHSGGCILIAFIKFSMVSKEWRFTRGELSKHIIYELEKII